VTPAAQSRHSHRAGQPGARGLRRHLGGKGASWKHYRGHLGLPGDGVEWIDAILLVDPDAGHQGSADLRSAFGEIALFWAFAERCVALRRLNRPLNGEGERNGRLPHPIFEHRGYCEALANRDGRDEEGDPGLVPGA
jgi:hypothetical protein